MSLVLLLPKTSLIPSGDRGSFHQRNERKPKEKGDSTECRLPEDEGKQVNCNNTRDGERGIYYNNLQRYYHYLL